MNRRCLLATLFAGVMALQPIAAHATLVGSTIEWKYYYEHEINGQGDFTVQRAETLGSRFGNNFGIHSDHNSITFRYHPSPAGTWSFSDLSLAPTIHNGIALNLTSAGKFISVQVDPSTNMVSFNGSRISFTAHQIQFDWQGLSFTPETIVRLDVKVRQKDE